MPENKKNKKKQPKRFIVLITVASQMGITIFLGATLGKYLDAKYQSEKSWLTITLTLFALLISLYSVLQTINKLNNDD
jgi:F0F1-type ATP synthase assembly protein I